MSNFISIDIRIKGFIKVRINSMVHNSQINLSRAYNRWIKYKTKIFD